MCRPRKILTNKIAINFNHNYFMMAGKYQKFYRFIALLIFCVTSPNAATFAAESKCTSELTIKEAIATAVEDNPNLAQMLARHKAFLEIPSQTGSLPDPTINLNAMNFPTTNFSSSQESMTQMQIGFSQAFPFPGKLSLKKEVSKFKAAAANNDVDEVRLELKERVKSSWWQVYFLDKSLVILDHNLNLLRQFIKIAQTKYKAGKGLQQDVLLAQLELSKLLDQKIQLESFRKNQVAKLNSLMGKKANLAIKLSKEVNEELPEILSIDTLFEEAILSKPTLTQIRQ